MRSKQKGLSLIMLIILLAVVGVVAVYGSQVGMAYLNKNTLEKATKVILLEYKGQDKVTSAEIRKSILAKVSMNNIDITSNDIVVTKDGNGFNVQVYYSKRVGVTEELSINLDFEIDETTPE